MRSVFTPKLWLEQNLAPINQTEEQARKNNKMFKSFRTEGPNTLSLCTVELNACEKIQGLLKTEHTDMLILSELIIPTFCKSSLSH